MNYQIEQIKSIATEKIIIINNGKKRCVGFVQFKLKENEMVVWCFNIYDINSIRVAVGDEIIHCDKVGVEETYVVELVERKNRERHGSGSSAIDRIILQVKNKKHIKNETKPFSMANINNSNITINSPHSSNNININYQEILKDEEIKEKLVELEEAINKKDKYKLKSVMDFLLDKGFDIGVGLLIAKITGQI